METEFPIETSDGTSDVKELPMETRLLMETSNGTSDGNGISDRNFRRNFQCKGNSDGNETSDGNFRQNFRWKLPTELPMETELNPLIHEYADGIPSAFWICKVVFLSKSCF